ncbi:MAG: hypothetical protein HUU28_15635, partial [Planctomycetaceae bacterium]|nr:hypothetical protein [Planctomycetaceae bacterium]
RAALEGKDSDPAAQLFRDAERNYLLVALDGSKGAHNVTYALDALRVAAERVDGARAALSLASETPVASGFPARTTEGCSECHAGTGGSASFSRAEQAFPHASHLAQGMDCSKCHSTTEHGKPAFPRSECATCHHQESEKFDVSECSNCHTAQDGMLRGSLAFLAEPKPGTMGEMDCYECHGEAPDIVKPKPQTCVLCHEAGYDKMFADWQAEIGKELARLERELATAAARGVAPEAIAKARTALESVRADGSVGAHNYELAKFLLGEAQHALASD